MTVRACIFDVDYTLIRPDATFDVQGYLENARRFGLTLHVELWPLAQKAAWEAVRERREAGHEHDMALIPAVTRAVVGALAGDDADPAACESLAQYQAEQWWDLHNYELYPDVLPCLERLRAAGLRMGLISNTDRDLDAAVEHFGLGRFIDAAVASAQLGIMKPEPRIFRHCLELLGCTADEAAMVGDNPYDDVDGARACGFAVAVLVDRRGRQRRLAERGEPVHEPAIASLAELPPLLGV